MAPNVANKRRINNPKNRQTKVNLVFDEKKRKEFLTGFSKRKAERKKKFAEKLKKEIKVERKRLQVELRAKISKSASSRCIPEIEHLARDEPHIFELPNHTVTIEPITDTQYKKENLFLGNNEVTTAAGTSNDEVNQSLADKKKQEKDLNRKTMKKLQKTKIFKRQVQVGRDKSRKKAKKHTKSSRK